MNWNKEHKSKFLFIAMLVVLSAMSCNKWEVEPGFTGSWESDIQQITVQFEPQPKKYDIIEGYAALSLTIYEDKTVDGVLGETSFSGATLAKRAVSSAIKGANYTVKCGTIGKIFENDPLSSKEVEIELNIGDGGKLEAALWYTENGADFPMGTFLLTKLDE